jgi:altronate dehydratase
MDEILALGRSNYQLLGVGNNLNQIAKQMNKSDVNDIRIETIQSVEKMIKEHVNIASDLIRAATERWELK